MPGPSLSPMRAVQITRFGGPEVLDIVDLPDPVPGDGQQLYEVSTAGVNFADTHQALSRDVDQRHSVVAGSAPRSSSEMRSRFQGSAVASGAPQGRGGWPTAVEPPASRRHAARARVARSPAAG
jgi:hypothetical protein